MTREERMEYRKAINVIDYKMLGKPHTPNELSSEQVEAIILAVRSMEEQMKATDKPLRKHIAVLSYHIKNPTAILFKDNITMDALEAGILAMKWLMNDDMYDNL